MVGSGQVWRFRFVLEGCGALCCGEAWRLRDVWLGEVGTGGAW